MHDEKQRSREAERQRSREHCICLCFLLLCFLLLSPKAHGWSSFTHSLIPQISLSKVSKEWKLEESVIVTPFGDFLKKLSQEKLKIQTREDFANWLKINPESKFDRHSKGEKVGEKTTPIKILSLYSPRADDGRDMNLPYEKEEQFWFGSGTTTGSQAFRHMEKPSFNLLHPLNTFGFPLGSIGQATQRAQIYFDLALLAHRLEEPYWAWHFLGIGLHYIEDLQNPYHSAQLLPPITLEGFKAYFKWGLQEKKGWIPTMTHIAANAHHYFEGYVDYTLSHNLPNASLWIDSLKGDDLFSSVSSIKGLATNIRNFANGFAYKSVIATFMLTGKTLKGPKIYAIGNDDDVYPEDPSSYFNPDSEARTEAAFAISDIVLKNFQYQGRAIRTVVRKFVDQTNEVVSSLSESRSL